MRVTVSMTPQASSGDMCLSVLQVRNVYCGIEHLLLPIDE